MSQRAHTIARALVAVSLFLVVLPLQADDTVCAGFTSKDRVLRLAGPNAFSKTGVKSPVELLEQMNAHRAEIQTLLDERGLGHLTGALFEAVESGRGISERDLVKGETWKWMASRKKGQPRTTGPVCFASGKTYGAYEIVVTEEKGDAATATCKVKADATCAEENVRVDASGSSPGVQVTMTGPGGSQTVVTSGTTWEGLVGAPGDYTFTAQASVTGTKTVTTHTFLVPKACLNFSYLGAKTETQQGEPARCSESTQIHVDSCLPECRLEVPAGVGRSEPFTVGATGRWDDLTITVDSNKKGRAIKFKDAAGNKVSEIHSVPQTISINRGGDYTVKGAVSNKAGSATCEAPLTVTSTTPDWTFRGAGVLMDPKEDPLFTSTFRPGGALQAAAPSAVNTLADVNERSDLRLHNGAGVRLGIERRFSERIGLEASLSWLQVDTVFMFDLDEAWEYGTDTTSFLSLQVGPNFHLTPDSRVDLYLGPFVGWVDMGDVSYHVLGETQKREFGDEFVFGAQLGVGIPVGDGGWGIDLGVSYIDLSIDVSGSEIDVNPLSGRVGLKYDF